MKFSCGINEDGLLYVPYAEVKQQEELKEKYNFEVEMCKCTLDELEVYKKALVLMAKDYCENMGCSFCQHHTKCLEANHFKDLEGKDYLQLLFLKQARKEE